MPARRHGRGGRYLTGQGNRGDSIRAFLQQTVRKSFSSAFRRAGDFSVRKFSRTLKGTGKRKSRKRQRKFECPAEESEPADETWLEDDANVNDLDID